MKEAIKVLEQEVKWHQDNPDKAKGMSNDWREGFIAGCEHCFCVLVSCKDAPQPEDLVGFKCPSCGSPWDTKKCNACQCGAVLKCLSVKI